MSKCSTSTIAWATLAFSALALAAPARAAEPAPYGAPPPQRGAALGLFSEDPKWSYVDMLDEMKRAGVSHVAIVSPWYLDDGSSSVIYPHPRYTMPFSTISRTIRDARARGLEVFLFPILRLVDGSGGKWRGNLAPADLAAFQANYRAFILKMARYAESERLPLFCVGSELSTLDVDEAYWRGLIAEIRGVYSGRLTYSANWDHFTEVRFFDALDYVGVTGYFELARPGEDPSLEQLVHGWRNAQRGLVRFAHRFGKPLILTEVGYLSQRDTAAWPWKEGASEPIDLELQRRCYEAVGRVWSDEPALAGLYLWNWFGWGGASSNEYTPRNKPAAAEIQRWYTRPR